MPARFKNTFAPYVENKELSVDAVIRLLFWGLPFQRLPDEVKHAVRAEMSHRHEKRYANTFLPEMESDMVSLQQVVNALVGHELTPDQLPYDVKVDVDFEMKKNFGLSLDEWWDEYHAEKYQRE